MFDKEKLRLRLNQCVLKNRPRRGCVQNIILKCQLIIEIRSLEHQSYPLWVMIWVCQLWRKIVNTIKLKRKSIGFSCSTREDCVWNTMRFLQTLFSEPKTVIAFGHNSINLSLEDLDVKRAEELAGLLHISKEELLDMGLVQFMKEFVPYSCEVVIIEAAGIVGTNTEMKTVEYESAEAITILSIPKLHNNEGLMVVTQADVTTVEEILPMKDSQALKACFLFCSDPSFLPESLVFGFKSLVSNLVDQHSVLVAGAFVDAVRSQRQRHDELEGDFKTCMSLSFYGDQVETASVILPLPCEMTKSDIEKSIIALKDMKLPDKNSFALMIAWLGRGERLYKEPNVESSLFRKHFPQTPLFGLFGEGIIGATFMMVFLNKPRTDNRQRNSPPKIIPFVYNSAGAGLCEIIVLSCRSYFLI